MGLLFSIIIIITLLLCFHYFSCASLQIHQFQSSLHHQGGVNAAHQQKISLPKTVPRKLRFTDEKVEEYDDEVVVRDNNIASHEQKGSLAAGKQHNRNQNMVLGSKGTRQEWTEIRSDDSSQYFTMDYARVRRRRPIHNKKLPVGP
ncbi:uncharacterized protein LOC107489602 [Arachis duranensis]|uniref:Uncharacterized protein LOC107489602 n=1 Tax=Arachis duranensis TaxID=130453 RepID=A0A6P4DCB0_ARADU|nr:uncharacterized protein LOC107489602 [Arachis duranensis]QHO42360.1 uncharacterized protein DS421_5g153480 [Arachis hypogaea]